MTRISSTRLDGALVQESGQTWHDLARAIAIGGDEFE